MCKAGIWLQELTCRLIAKLYKTVSQLFVGPFSLSLHVNKFAVKMSMKAIFVEEKRGFYSPNDINLLLLIPPSTPR